MPEAEPAYRKADEERQDDDPEELQEEQWQQEHHAVSKSPHHGNSLFLCVYSHGRGSMFCYGIVRCHHGSNLFYEQSDISFYSLEQSDISFYFIYDMSRHRLHSRQKRKWAVVRREFPQIVFGSEIGYAFSETHVL